MRTFTVTIVETVEYEVQVDALDSGEAQEQAEEMLCDADDPNEYFVGVLARETTNVQDNGGC